MDIPQLRTVSTTDFSSDAFKATLRQASGLLPFHAWIANSDLKDEHVMVRSGRTTGTYEVASIDFASAFGWDPSGGAVTLPPGPPVLLQHRDAREIGETIAIIEAIPPACVTGIVQSMPDEILPSADKRRIIDGLISRKSLLRPAFAGAGWLSDESGK